MTAKPEPDENLPAALTHYRRALAGLLDPTPDHPDGRYAALQEAIPGRQGTGGHHARSMPPLWIDAIQLLAQIDAEARRWHRHTKTTPKSLTDAPGVLESLSEASWRPMDSPKINDWANTITGWALDIDQLTLTTEHKWELAAPCPACQTTTTHRTDTAGERVRQPALQITANGCVCTHCHTTWQPNQFQFLATVIGCQQIP